MSLSLVLVDAYKQMELKQNFVVMKYAKLVKVLTLVRKIVLFPLMYLSINVQLIAKQIEIVLLIVVWGVLIKRAYKTQIVSGNALIQQMLFVNVLMGNVRL